MKRDRSTRSNRSNRFSPHLFPPPRRGGGSKEGGSNIHGTIGTVGTTGTRATKERERCPLKTPIPADPNMLVGVMLPADAEATRDMAYVFAEEFARMGYSREQLLWLFKNPFYGGAHGAYRALGEQETLTIIDECLNVWGNIRISDSGCSIQDGRTAQTPNPPPRLGGG